MSENVKNDDWRIKGNEDYLNNLTLYKVVSPTFGKNPML